MEKNSLSKEDCQNRALLRQLLLNFSRQIPNGNNAWNAAYEAWCGLLNFENDYYQMAQDVSEEQSSPMSGV